MNSGEGTQPQVHLKKIEPDQSLDGIDTLDDTIRNDAGRKWFASQHIMPVVIQGHYNATSGRYVIGNWRDTMTPNSSWTTTSAAALTLTCATGHRYRVYYAGCRNATQASTASLSGVIGGNAWTGFEEDQGGGMPALSTIICVGTSGSITDALGGTWAKRVPTEIWLNAADTLTMTLSVYAAGNNTEHLFMFEDYTV